MTSRVTLLLALAALVAVVPLALTSVARSRATSPRAAGASADAGDASLAAAARDAAALERSAPNRPASTTADARARARTQAAAFTPSPKPVSSFAVARLRKPAVLRSRPGGGAITRVANGTQFGSPHVLGVARRRGRWLGVVSSALPNGKLGWLRRDDPAVGLARVRYSLHADLSARSLELRRGGRRIARFAVAIGRPGSTTPTGRFAVTDKLAGSNFGPYYGCCVLALSGHQPNMPPGWPGGNRLAIHGTDAPASIGQPSSAGCLRASDRDLSVLMRRVPLGTPLFIHA